MPTPVQVSAADLLQAVCVGCAADKACMAATAVSQSCAWYLSNAMLYPVSSQPLMGTIGPTLHVLQVLSFLAECGPKCGLALVQASPLLLPLLVSLVSSGCCFQHSPVPRSGAGEGSHSCEESSIADVVLSQAFWVLRHLCAYEEVGGVLIAAHVPQLLCHWLRCNHADSACCHTVVIKDKAGGSPLLAHAIWGLFHLSQTRMEACLQCGVVDALEGLLKEGGGSVEDAMSWLFVRLLRVGDCVRICDGGCAVFLSMTQLCPPAPMFFRARYGISRACYSTGHPRRSVEQRDSISDTVFEFYCLSFNLLG